MKAAVTKYMVSVITPVFNSEKTLKRVLESVRDQTLSSVEHILIDDGSTDSSALIISNFAKENEDVMLLTQVNLGAGAARNKAIEMANGKYISFLDADDFWSPEKLENQINFMESQGYQFTYTDYFKVQNDQIVGKTNVPKMLSYNQLLVNCPIGCLTAVYNQHMLGKVYMSLHRQGQDWSLWLKITKGGIMARKAPYCDAYYSLAANSLSSSKKKKLVNMFRIYRESEGLSLFKSLYFLVCHSLNRLKKS